MDHASEPMSEEALGQAALRRGFVTPAQLKDALAEQAREVSRGRAAPRALANILVSKGLLSAPQLASLRESPGQDPGRYQVKEELARGGMGAILRAEDRELRRLVAMKVMLDPGDGASRARFVEEAQITGQLEHPNIVPVHELGTDAQARPFFTMKLVKGRSLSQILKDLREHPDTAGREFGLARLLGVFVNVCHAMAFAHSKGVVHRDLKPANLMLGDYGEVLVMDWGLAKVGAAVRPKTDRWASPGAKAPTMAVDAALEEVVRSLRQDTREELTVDGAIMGTPHYMPPEQANGDLAKIDARSDLYSLGAILYEILTLKPPVEGRTIHELLLNVVEGRIRPPEERTPERAIPPELSAVAMKALATRPAQRYASVDLLRRDIELHLEGRAVSAKADSAWETLVKLARRNKAAALATAAAALVVSAVVGAGYWFNLQERREAERQRNVAQGALTAFKAEQELRLKQQRASAPALLSKARRGAAVKDWEAALQDVEIAIAFDPGLADARRLRSELLAGRKRFADAAAEAGEVLRLKPGDPEALRFRDLCLEGAKAETSAVAVGLREYFAQRGLPELSALFAGSHKELEASYREILRKAWPDAQLRMDMIPDGRIQIKLNDLNISDLSCLRGMPIRLLWVYNNPITDLKPLEGLPIEDLHLSNTRVSDLGPLRGMRLTVLNAPGDAVDLRPLAGMPLRSFDLYASKLTDVSPLAGMKLQHLGLASCRSVTSLETFRGMPLEYVDLRASSVTDLSPLRGAPLHFLNLLDTLVTDLTPLEGAPLEKIALNPRTIRKGMELLRGMRSLKQVEPEVHRVLEATEFWNRYDAGEWAEPAALAKPSPIVAWKLLGPVPLTTPLPADPAGFARQSEFKDPAGKIHRWADVPTDDGVVRLAKIYATEDKVAAYAVAEIPSDARKPVEFVGGSDDSIRIWLNGVLIFSDDNNHAYAERGFAVHALLEAGPNVLLVRCGNDGGKDWLFSVGIRK